MQRAHAAVEEVLHYVLHSDARNNLTTAAPAYFARRNVAVKTLTPCVCRLMAFAWMLAV
jgi:hypothetical protein